MSNTTKRNNTREVVQGNGLTNFLINVGIAYPDGRIKTDFMFSAGAILIGLSIWLYQIFSVFHNT